MVQKGQFLERPTLIPTTGGLVLEALSHRGDRRPGLLILPPPPFQGSGMDHVVAAELAFAASHLGFPTLRFNYRGVGASQGRRSTEKSHLEELFADARAAFELAADNAPGARPVVASLGASDAVALRLALELGASGLALVSPVVVRPADLAALRIPIAVITAELDPAVDRAAWSGAPEWTVVPGADASFQRGLPTIGKVVCALLASNP